jgi:hypothetical protein
MEFSLEFESDCKGAITERVFVDNQLIEKKERVELLMLCS